MKGKKGVELLWVMLLYFSFFGQSIQMNYQKLIPLSHDNSNLKDEIISTISKELPETIGPQYSGLLPVNETFNGELFYWFFSTTNESAPIILWLEGGPGIPGSFQVFNGMGPYRISKLGEVSFNENTWNNNFHLLFFDNPLGVGFSSVDEGGFATDEYEVAQTLFVGLQLFFQLYPQFQKNEIFFFGESYGGKYVPALSYFVYYVQHLEEKAKNSVSDQMMIDNDDDVRDDRLRSFQEFIKRYYDNVAVKGAMIKLNFQGLGIGDGLVDPPVQIQTIDDFLYFHGLCSLDQKSKISMYENKFLTLYNEGNYNEASNLFWSLISFIQYVDHVNIYNVDCDITCGIQDYSWGAYARLLNQTTIKIQLHVPPTYSFSSLASNASSALNSDVSKSIAYLFPTLLSNYKILLYQGTLDLICNAAGNDLWLANVTWSGMNDFQNTKKYAWFDGVNVAGYVRAFSNLTQIYLPNAGHFVTMDQPSRANLMLFNWLYDLPFQSSIINSTISY